MGTPARVVVDNRIRMSVTAIGAVAASALKTAHEHKNPEIGKRLAIGKSIWGVPDKLRTWEVKGDELSLPRGGMSRVREILKANAVASIFADQRSEGAPLVRPIVYRGFPLRPHQEAMVRAGMSKEQCILRAATGGGKTVAAFALAAEIGLNTLIILPTKELFNQWAEWAEGCLGIRGDALGVIQGPRRRLRPITIAMQATLARGVSEDVREFFGAVIVDEVQRAAADSMVRIIDCLPARYRIGVSASEKRKDRKECLTHDLFGAVAYEAGRDELTKSGIILDVEIRVVPTAFIADWYGAHADGELDFNRLLAEMTADEKRNALALRYADEEIAKGEQVIMLTHRREHARDLDAHFVERAISSGCLLGDGEPGDAEEFAKTRAGIHAGEVRVGVGTYGAIGYGIDLPAVSVGIATTPIATNEQQFNQVRGRLCRTNAKAGKTHGRLYVLVDTRVFGTKPIRNIIAWNKSVVVQHKGQWISGRDYMAAIRMRPTG